MSMLSPRARWNISRIFPFGIIYLVTMWVFILVELSVYHSSESSSYFVLSSNFEVVLFVTVASFMVGILVGLVEMIWLRNLFRNRPLFQKVVYKLLVYVIGGFLVIVFFLPIAISVEYGIPPWQQDVMAEVKDFLTNITFYSSLLQMAFAILLCLIYAAISDNLGHSVFINFFTGKYHQPIIEQRIFMFLDMTDSTAIAEKLGDAQYFKFLSAYYETFSKSIINHFGEVYQYVGDEIVISWPMDTGLLKANCVKCFFAMEKELENRRDDFVGQFGVYPQFKASLHAGQVTSGEIGALKKEITYSGDVLNVTARIQGLCNKYQANLLVSGSLLQQLDLEEARYNTRHLGREFLKGRSEPVELYTVRLDNSSMEHQQLHESVNTVYYV